MATTPGNAINEKTTGITGFTGNAFVGTPVTSNAVIKGGATSSALINTTVIVDSSNRVTNVNQPMFNAYLSTSASNVTGDGTNYTVICDGVLSNQGSNYNSATGVFTAPVTGTYFLNFGIYLLDVTSLHTAGLTTIVTTLINYTSNTFNPGVFADASTENSYQQTVLARMTAGDTASVLVNVQNYTKTVSLGGNVSTAYTYFQGFLVC